MHIVIITSEIFQSERDKLGGIFQLNQANALVEGGHKVGILSVGWITLRYSFRRYKYDKYQEIGSVRVYRRYHRSLLIERLSNPINRANALSELFRRVFGEYVAKHGLPDMIHAHNLLPAGLSAFKIKTDFGVPFMIVEHSSAFLRGMYSESIDTNCIRIARQSVGLFCVSSSFAGTLTQRLKLNVGVIPNTIGQLFFEGNLTTETKTKFKFLSVGNLDENKNHQLLINAFASLYRGRDFCLTIIGSGALKKTLQRQCKHLGVSDQVEFIDYVDNGDLPQLMRESNCLVLPSNHETFGVVLIEGLASGLPLIATRSGGPSDIVNAGNGFLIEPGSLDELKESMSAIGDKKILFSREKLRFEAYEKYSYKAFNKTVVSTMKTLIR